MEILKLILLLGNVQVDLILFVDIYLDKTNIRVGTITVTVVADIMVRMMGQRIIANASLPIFRLMDRDQTLGLPQDTLDNLASLANDIILKVYKSSPSFYKLYSNRFSPTH